MQERLKLFASKFALTQAQTPGNLTYLLVLVKQLSAGNFLSVGQDVQSTCAKSQFSAAHTRRALDERGGWGKVDRLHSSKINLTVKSYESVLLYIPNFLLNPSRVRDCDEAF